MSSTLSIKPGPFDIELLIAAGKPVGLLVLDGLLIAEVQAGRARIAWLVGADDLIRPWEMDELPLTRKASWRALSAATVVPVARASGKQHVVRDRAITEELLSRAARTSHWLLAQALILSAPSAEERLLMLFALYGERWGKVTPRGIRLDLPLTHELLAKLCGARRPTVTLALRSLVSAGFLAHASSGTWLLPLRAETDGHRRSSTWWPDVLGLDGDGRRT